MLKRISAEKALKTVRRKFRDHLAISYFETDDKFIFLLFDDGEYREEDYTNLFVSVDKKTVSAGCSTFTKKCTGIRKNIWKPWIMRSC